MGYRRWICGKSRADRGVGGFFLLRGFVVSLVCWCIGEGNVMERCEGSGGWFEEEGGGF